LDQRCSVPDFRDVDVRAIVDDDEFDAVFGPRREFWGMVCLTTTMYLRAATGLPIDFQVQRMTEANALDGTPRNPLGFGIDASSLAAATQQSSRL
jgi:hypothetical protein